MEISLGGMEQLLQADRPRRAQPLDLLLPGEKWLYPCCLETRDSVLPRNISLSFHCHLLPSGLAARFFKISSHAVFLCVSVLPFIPRPTLLFSIDFSEVSCKHGVSRTTGVAAVFCLSTIPNGTFWSQMWLEWLLAAPGYEEQTLPFVKEKK